MAFSSPKRKRSEEQHMVPLQTTALFPRHPAFTSDNDNDGEGSPRTKVARKFQQLNISNYELDKQLAADGRESKRMAHLSDDEVMESSQESNFMLQQTDGPSEAQSAHQPPTAQSFTFERTMSTVFPKGESPRPKSPSLSGEISDQYWHESEITGHDPDDPDDDGYGINGIGFRPTSAMAYARTQRRKQQIAEYRSREAKEARQRRNERRRIGSAEMRNASSTPPTPSKSRVRFDDG